MHVARTIRAFFDRHFHCAHRQRFRAVADAVTGLILGGKASLTSIGRNMVVAVAPKASAGLQRYRDRIEELAAP